MEKPKWAAAYGEDLTSTGQKNYWADLAFPDYSAGWFVLNDSAKQKRLEESPRYRFRYIPPGDFEMGNLSGTAPPFTCENTPASTAEIHNEFWIGETTFSRKLYNHVVETNQALQKRGFEKTYISEEKDKDLPCHLSWYDASIFALVLSESFKSDIRLPTEIEWEYACRAGSKTDFFWGLQMETGRAACDFSYDPELPGGAQNFKQLIAGLERSIDEGKLKPVYHYTPNDFGLYQMHGNVLEWCLDRYQSSKTRLGTSEASLTGDRYGVVSRGGSWRSDPEKCASWCRLLQDPCECSDNMGFRLMVTNITEEFW